MSKENHKITKIILKYRMAALLSCLTDNIYVLLATMIYM